MRHYREYHNKEIQIFISITFHKTSCIVSYNKFIYEAIVSPVSYTHLGRGRPHRRRGTGTYQERPGALQDPAGTELNEQKHPRKQPP